MALLQELQLSQKEHQLHKVLKKWDKIDLVIAEEEHFRAMNSGISRWAKKENFYFSLSLNDTNETA